MVLLLLVVIYFSVRSTSYCWSLKKKIHKKIKNLRANLPIPRLLWPVSSIVKHKPRDFIKAKGNLKYYFFINKVKISHIIINILIFLQITAIILMIANATDDDDCRWKSLKHSSSSILLNNQVNAMCCFVVLISSLHEESKTG